jgi:Xaa-Pro dipeptidase
VPDNHELRRSRLRERLADLDLGAALITRLVNVRYLTGFTGSNGAVLVTADGAVLTTDGRYTTQAGEQAPDVELVIERAVVARLAREASTRGVRRLGFEEHDVTVAAYDSLTDAAHGAELVRLGRPVEDLRAVKDEDEIAALARACAVADAAFAAVIAGLRPGLTEREVARRLESRMFDEGAEAPSFETIVASGPNSAVPHHSPTDRVLAAGDLVKCDFGALVDGYHSDMTRTVVIGPPSAWQQEIYDVVAAAQSAGRAALRPGAECRAVDAVARNVIVEAGYGAEFVHGLGHGVGLEIHESPSLGAAATGRLDDRMPVTVEPGVYLPGRGGVRIEDTLVVRPDGPELLTMTTRDLLVL